MVLFYFPIYEEVVNPDLDILGSVSCGPLKLLKKKKERQWNLVLNH